MVIKPGRIIEPHSTFEPHTPADNAADTKRILLLAPRDKEKKKTALKTQALRTKRRRGDIRR